MFKLGLPKPMKAKNYIIILSILSINFVYGQNNQGSRLTAMGNNGAAVKDIWGVQANPSGINEVRSAAFQFNYQKYLLAEGLSSQALALVLPFQNKAIGLNLQRYGISSYHEIKAGVIFSKQFGPRLAIGWRGNYHQIKITNYGTSTAFSIDVGMMYQLNKQLCFGLHLNNPSQERHQTKPIPSTFHIGIAYRTSEKLLIATTISYDLMQSTMVAIGIDYQLIESMSLRGGLSIKPFNRYAGLGLNLKKLSLDLSITSNPNLGFLPQITIGYAF